MATISVVLPAYFSHATLGRCLVALAAQTRPPDEVIVVNSSDETDTAEVVSQFPQVHFIQSPHRLLPHAARNVGLAAARGDVLVCSDPDVVACPSWIAQLEAAVNGGHQMVGGAMDMQPHPECHRRVAEAIHLTKFWWALPSGVARPAWIVPTANCAFTRTLWERVGPFPEHVFCGDAVLSWRATRAGSAPWFVPAAIVAHEHLERAAAMRTQRFRRGEEFARERARWEGWTRGRRCAESVASPLRVAKVMAEARAAATAAGWARAYWRTVDLQTLFHGAWIAGEARGWLSGQ